MAVLRHQFIREKNNIWPSLISISVSEILNRKINKTTKDTEATKLIRKTGLVKGGGGEAIMLHAVEKQRNQDNEEKGKIEDWFPGNGKVQSFLKPVRWQLRMYEKIVIKSYCKDNLGGNIKYLNKFWQCTSCQKAEQDFIFTS